MSVGPCWIGKMYGENLPDHVQRTFLSHVLIQWLFHAVGQNAVIGGRTILALQTAAAAVAPGGSKSSELSRNAHLDQNLALSCICWVGHLGGVEAR
jgi:hypothetical protein